MSWVSSNPPESARAYALLTDRNWRLRHSAWMLWALLSCGLFSFIGFAYVAAKTKKRRWWIYAGFWAVVAAGYFTYSSLTTDARKAQTESSLSSAVGNVLMVLLVASLVLVFFLNRPWLRWLADDQVRREAAVDAMVHRFQAGSAPQAQGSSLPPVLHDLGISPGQFYGSGPASQPQPGGSAPTPTPVRAPSERPPDPATIHAVSPDASQSRVVVNSVSAEELGNALDIAPDRAALIVQERNARGPYRSIEDFGVRAGFTPVDLNRLRERLSFERPPSQAPSTGRVLDL